MGRPGDTGKRSPGQPMQAPPAEVWNNMVAAGQHHAQRVLGDDTAPPLTRRRTDIVKVRNDAPDDLDRGSLLALDDIITDPDDFEVEYPFFSGIKPTRQHRTTGVLTKALKQGDIGELQLFGVCMAQVQINDQANDYCYLLREDSDTYALKASRGGDIPILWKPTDTISVAECLVDFRPRQGVPTLVKITVDADPAEGQWTNGDKCDTATGWVVRRTWNEDDEEWQYEQTDRPIQTIANDDPNDPLSGGELCKIVPDHDGLWSVIFKVC